MQHKKFIFSNKLPKISRKIKINLIRFVLITQFFARKLLIQQELRRLLQEYIGISTIF